MFDEYILGDNGHSPSLQNLTTGYRTSETSGGSILAPLEETSRVRPSTSTLLPRSTSCTRGSLTEMTRGIKRSMTRLLFFLSTLEVKAVEVLLAVLCERVIHKGYSHTFIVPVCGWMFFQEMSQFCFI